MGLFNNSSTPSIALKSSLVGTQFKVPIAMEHHLFYAIGQHHAMFVRPIEIGTSIKVGVRIPMAGMFEVYELLVDETRAGFMFVSQFNVRNEGGYLVAFTQAGAGKAVTVEVLLKTEDLVVYNYPNKGTMCISPSINDEVEVIFQEQ